jgi:DNA-binding response OmpR family regulator
MSTVLLVEDQSETRKPLAKLLRLEGYEVLTARDAYAAAAAIRNESPDLVLLDVGIAPMDGLTMLSLLRDEPQFREIPVVVVTGQTDENVTARAHQLGVKCCLIKSRFTPEQLLDTVRENIRKSPADS